MFRTAMRTKEKLFFHFYFAVKSLLLVNSNQVENFVNMTATCLISYQLTPEGFRKQEAM